jgi:hypothetical protein
MLQWYWNYRLYQQRETAPAIDKHWYVLTLSEHYVETPGVWKSTWMMESSVVNFTTLYNRSTTLLMFNIIRVFYDKSVFWIRQSLEKQQEHDGAVHQSFIKFKKVYGSVSSDFVFHNNLNEYGRVMRGVGFTDIGSSQMNSDRLQR